jgi:hypothetical protein
LEIEALAALLSVAEGEAAVELEPELDPAGVI